LQDTSDTPKHLLLTPSSVNEGFSQNIAKLTLARGRIGKITFRCKYVNDSQLAEWLPENELPKQLVQNFYVMEDCKRVLKTSLLERARALRPQVDDESNPHSTRSKSLLL